MHAHSGGPHGITLRIKTKHSWRCSQDAGERAPARLAMHPAGCQCGQLPPSRPLELDRPPPPPPPMTATQVLTCPPPEHNSAGWEVCTWPLTRPPIVPATALDLEGIVGLDVRSSSLAVLLRCIARAKNSEDGVLQHGPRARDYPNDCMQDQQSGNTTQAQTRVAKASARP
jgi:hypothetical protein